MTPLPLATAPLPGRPLPSPLARLRRIASGAPERGDLAWLGAAVDACMQDGMTLDQALGLRTDLRRHARELRDHYLRRVAAARLAPLPTSRAARAIIEADRRVGRIWARWRAAGKPLPSPARSLEDELLVAREAGWRVPRLRRLQQILAPPSASGLQCRMLESANRPAPPSPHDD